jgi:hypothetical protein
MNRAKPHELRAMALMAQTFTKHGVLFVPMPVTSEEEFKRLQTEAWEKLDAMEAAAEVKP